MSDHSGESVTRWVRALERGQRDAVQPLWERYFERLVRLAHARLRAQRAPTGADSEDAALSAFHSFCARAARGDFPKLADRDDLWRLLATITARKVRDQRKRETRLKRGGGLVRREGDLERDDPDRAQDGLDDLAGSEPTPEFAVGVAEETQRLLERLGDETLRQVALWKLEGYSNREIAERLGCSPRMVGYRLELIRKLWEDEAP